jgi:pimeloyl-ACP methyl ester carboxylesterase
VRSIARADDVALLARGLGGAQIRLVGASYGSHLGLSVIRRHPELVDRALLALVEGPDQTHKLPSNVQAHLELIAGLAAESPALDGSVPDLTGLLADLLDRLRSEPVTADADGRRIVCGAYDLQRAVCGCLGSREEIAALPARLLALAGGDTSWLAAETMERRTAFVHSLMYWHTDAASGATPERRARLRAEASTTLLGDVINHPFPDVEVALGSPDLGPAFRSPIQTDVPVQFQSGGIDGRTPPSNVDELIGGLRTAGHLIVDGVAHDEGLASAEVRSIGTAFLAGADPVTRRVAIPFSFDPAR